MARGPAAAALLWCAAHAAGQAPLRDPAASFGFRPGADRVAPSYDALLAYYAELDRASDRVLVALPRDEAGEPRRSVEGRPLPVVYVGAPDVLARLDALRAVRRRVARGDASDAELLDPAAPAAVLISAGVHGPEPSGVLAGPELVRGLAALDGPETAAVRDRVLLVFVPCANPDGYERMRAWAERTRDTPYEGTWPPYACHAFAGRDNNRDAVFLRFPESRALHALLLDEAPDLYVDQHQMAPTDARLFVGELASPASPGMDPRTLADTALAGAFVRATLTGAGYRGLLHRANWDGAWQGAFFTKAWALHTPALLTESAGARLLAPLRQREEDLDGAYRRGVGKDGNRKDWNHPWPWTGGWWRPRDAVEYDLAAARAALTAAAVFRPRLATGRRDAARAARAAGVGGWLVPVGDDAAGRAGARLVALARAAGLDCEDGPFAGPDGGPAAFVPAAQPFGPFAADLCEPRTLERGAPHSDFDLSGWTPALLLGASPRRVAERPPRAPALPAGAASAPTSAETAPSSPRPVGLYRSYVPAEDEGWTRYLLTTRAPGTGEPFLGRGGSVRLLDADVRAGATALAARCDVIVLPSQPAREIRDGHPAGSLPPEFCGGLGAAGAAALAAFVRGGGRLVCVDRAAEFALELFGRDELPVVDATAALPPSEFACPGALLAADVDPAGPFAGGSPPALVLPFVGSRAFDLVDAGRGRVDVVARYASPDPLRAGRALGTARIAGKVMALRARVGAGDVVLFGAPPLFRAQPEAAFPLFRRVLRR